MNCEILTTNYELLRHVAESNQSNAHIGKKLSNFFNRFHTFFSLFHTFFQIFLQLLTVFNVFKHELARLMRKSALLIEILTHLRINSCPADLSVRSPDGIGTKAEALAKADALMIDIFPAQNS
jgi:hypothetical protein